MMLHRLTISAALISCGIFALAPKVSAQSATVTVPFTSVVPGTCTFGSPTGGILGVSSNAIGSDVSGGANGAVSLTCNTNANVTLSPPAPVSNAAVDLFNDPNTICSYATSGGPINIGTFNVTCTTATSQTQAVNTGVITLLQVYMRVSNNTTPIPAGTYTFNEVLTAAPF